MLTNVTEITLAQLQPEVWALKNQGHRFVTMTCTDLGDARSFSLDSPKSRVPRIEALKSASGNYFTNIQAITKKPGRRRI